MKKKITIILSVILAVVCISAIVVSAADSLQQTPKTAVNQFKNYYAYYNESSMKGAVAFCLDNSFVSYGTSETPLKLCTKAADDTYTTLYNIDKANVTTWFYGKTDYTVSASNNVSSLLGGLSGIGLTLESNKTNIAFALKVQPITRGTEYFVYVPEDYFTDALGNGNAACYLTIEPTEINSYTGDLMTDLKTATSGIYDAVLFAAESVGGVLS